MIYFVVIAGFDHRRRSKDIDLNSVRLCFQAFLPRAGAADKPFPLEPVISEAIHDKKANAELVIFDISDVTSPSAGGKKIMIFVEKVAKEDISVRFYETDPSRPDHIVWEAYGDFQTKNVHRQTAIALRTPKYRFDVFDAPVNVWMTLQRRSDRLESEPRPFQYISNVTNGCYRVNIKKRKIAESSELLEYLQKQQNHPNALNIISPVTVTTATTGAATTTAVPTIQTNIKTEYNNGRHQGQFYSLQPQHQQQQHQQLNSADGAVGGYKRYHPPPSQQQQQQFHEQTPANQYYDPYSGGGGGASSTYNNTVVPLNNAGAMANWNLTNNEAQLYDNRMHHQPQQQQQQHTAHQPNNLMFQPSEMNYNNNTNMNQYSANLTGAYSHQHHHHHLHQHPQMQVPPSKTLDATVDINELPYLHSNDLQLLSLPPGGANNNNVMLQTNIDSYPAPPSAALVVAGGENGGGHDDMNNMTDSFNSLKMNHF